MNLGLNEQIEVNRWLIKNRWYYISLIFLIGVASNLSSRGMFKLPWSVVIGLTIFGLFINFLFVIQIKSLEKNHNAEQVKNLSFLQIAFELSIFTCVFYEAASIETVSYLFFFLPIISSSVLFGLRGALIVSTLSSFLISLVLYLEKTGIILHQQRFEIISNHYLNNTTLITKVVNIIIFYYIIAVFSSIIYKILISQEEKLKEESQKYKAEKVLREDQLSRLNSITNVLLQRDKELMHLNEELDEKVHEQKKSEKALMQAFRELTIERENVVAERNKTVAVIDNFVDPIILIDAEGRIILINPAAKRVFGIDSGIINQPVSSKNHYSLNNFRNLFKTEYKVQKRKMESGTVVEEVNVYLQGREYTYKVITSLVMNYKKNVIGVMKIFYNLTREKMIDKMKSEFISIAAHQLRTPLSAIKWALKILLDEDLGKLNKDQYELLYKGYKSNERVINLINDMLNVSRIEEGRFGYDLAPVKLNDLIQKTITTLEPLIEEKKLDFKFIKPREAIVADIDAEKMALVIQNLIENAIKYTPARGKIEVILKNDDKFIKLIIRDSGVGIPKEEQKKLFSKFFRASNVIRMQTEGSGLGLFIAKNIVEKHHGVIQVKSEEGKGTEFIIMLPKHLT